MNLTLCLLALVFGAMVAVGDGPRTKGNSDDLAALAEALEANGVEAAIVDPDKAIALTAPAAEVDSPAVEVTRASLPLLETSVTATSAATVAIATETTVGAPQTQVAAAPAVRMAVVLGNRVNVRAGPSTGNPVINKVVKGQEVELLGYSDNGWAEILVQGKVGFMSGAFLREKADG